MLMHVVILVDCISAHLAFFVLVYAASVEQTVNELHSMHFIRVDIKIMPKPVYSEFSPPYPPTC